MPRTHTDNGSDREHPRRGERLRHSESVEENDGYSPRSRGLLRQPQGTTLAGRNGTPPGTTDDSGGCTRCRHRCARHRIFEPQRHGDIPQGSGADTPTRIRRKVNHQPTTDTDYQRSVHTHAEGHRQGSHHHCCHKGGGKQRFGSDSRERKDGRSSRSYTRTARDRARSGFGSN